MDGNEDSKQRFRALYEACIDEVYGYVYLRTGMKADRAEDICQEIFLAVYRGMNHFRGDSSERTWVYKIARNKITDYYRKSFRMSDEPLSADDEAVTEFEDKVGRVEDLVEKTYNSQCVADCFRALPEHYRMVLILKYMDDVSVKKIAAVTGKSAKAVESLLQRAKASFIAEYRRLCSEEVG